MTLSDLGTYGILVTSVALSVQFLGMEFYVFNTREILGSDQVKRTILVRDQLAFHGLAYLLLLPIFSILFFINILPWSLIVWFYILVIVEHLSLEICRFLTVIGRPVLANFLEFIRTGSWVAIAIAIGLQIPEYRSIQTIVVFWILGGLLSLLIGGKPLLQWDWSATLKTRLDLGWIRKGISVAMPFFVSMTALSTIYFSDRFIIQHFRGIEQVGLYTFHQSVAGLVSTAVATGIIVIISPKLVRAFLVRDMPQYTQELKTLTLSIISGSILISLFLILVFPFAADFMKNPQFFETRSTFIVLLLGHIAQNLSFIPHYVLYARSFDRDLLWATLSGAIVNIGLNLLWVPKFGILGAAWATTAAFTVLLGAKLGLVKIRSKQPSWTQPASETDIERSHSHDV
jgi:O-antigen/teichoic acid export membrane protein